MNALRYSGPFWFLASIPLLYAVSGGAPFLTPVAVLFALLASERIGGSVSSGGSSAGPRVLPILYIPCQVMVTLWAAHLAATASPLTFCSLALSVGVCTGVFGVLAAHEMVHSRIRWHNQLGAFMLTWMSYRHFQIAHVHGHHRFAATARDPSTARLGESFYAFFTRTLISQFLEAWRFEGRRCRGKSRPLMRHRIAQDIVIVGAVYCALTLAWGWWAAAFLAAESAMAILVLELFNYVAHYGLERKFRGGRLEPFGKHHSWNSSGAGNLLIFNMGRHSDHHRVPFVSYEELRPAQRQPELPFGYAGSIMLALVPSRWRTVMDHRIAQLSAHPSKMRYGGSVSDSPALRERVA